MKKFFLHTLAFVLGLFNVSLSQDIKLAINFPKTYTDNPCSNCSPPGYTVVSGGPVALSNLTGLGGSPIKPWYANLTPPPTSGKAIDSNTGKIFLTLRHNAVQKDKVKTIVSGFEPGNKYTLFYHVMASRVQLTSSTTSDYASAAIVEVQTTNAVGVASKTTTFTPGVNVNTWVEQSVTFTAPATNLVFYLSGLSNPQETAYVNFDIYSKPFNCQVPGGQVELFRGTIDTPFACATTNLNELIKSAAPAGTTPVWSTYSEAGFSDMTEAEAKAATPKPAGQYYYAFFKTAGGCYNTDVSTAKVAFTATPTQVSLSSNTNTINCINQTGVNLSEKIAPTTYKVQWFTNDTHQGIPIDNPSAAPVNTYYAFYYDVKNNCYSVNKAAAGATFLVAGSTMCCNDPNDPSNQIPLLNSDVKIVAPATTYDLTKLIPSNYVLPSGVVLEWHTTNDHSGTPIPDPQHAAAGKYYPFSHDLNNGCFNVPLSKSFVNVTKACNAGNTPVAINYPSADRFFCQEGEPPIILSAYVIGSPPAGLSVVWYDNVQHTGNPVTVAQVGGDANDNTGNDYYAFFYDDANQCFSPPAKPLYFLSKTTPLNCPTDGCLVSTGCPATGIDLNTFHQGAIPNGWELRWFKNNVHAGEPLSNVAAVTEEGYYYAFYYNTGKQCYNKKEVPLPSVDDDGTGVKRVIITNPCAGPMLDLRVVLQGARSTGSGDDIMRNDLQVYFGSSGLLPTTSPYGDLATCPDINNASKMGNVSDWVKVEIRDAVDPSMLLESKSLILLASGIVTDVDGFTQPSFSSQSKPVRIVVKHRNHLAVMSNPIQSFSSGTVSYDFTTALSQASNAFGSPDQMVQKNGVWCMRVGDINANQDYAVDGVDGTYFNGQFKADLYDAYDRADLNMDGFVDGVDGTLFNINFYLDIYSTIINY